MEMLVKNIKIVHFLGKLFIISLIFIDLATKECAKRSQFSKDFKIAWDIDMSCLGGITCAKDNPFSATTAFAHNSGIWTTCTKFYKGEGDNKVTEEGLEQIRAANLFGNDPYKENPKNP